jgi:hypothetical protein
MKFLDVELRSAEHYTHDGELASGKEGRKKLQKPKPPGGGRFGFVG